MILAQFTPEFPVCCLQFLKDVDWGDLDFLIVDAPPGTSDEHISVAQVCVPLQHFLLVVICKLKALHSAFNSPV